ncbi:PTS sugar transporter subunit IIB [Liberiplasma polymorphum]|uniref:PTS sugar transporter subunit IIB n=1 Tax=Liberiplasma polymorphum TaxID=3374570 RepID=UPI00377332EF
MKILAVCGFGVGSSMILKMTILKVLKDLGKEAEVINTDISDAKSYKADAIFTSPDFVSDLKDRVKVDLYPIKKYADKEEVKAQLEKLFAK